MIRNLKRLMSSINLGYAVPMSLEEKLQRLKTDPAWTTIELPIPDSSNAVEEVLVEKIGENRFRVASSPGMLEGLAADDIIALDNQTPGGYSLIQRGGNICVHVFCGENDRDEVQAGLSQVLGKIGGVLDGTMGKTGLCYTVPVVAGFSVIEGALRRIVGEEWSYSNVYDLETQEPLNWWLKQ